MEQDNTGMQVGCPNCGIPIPGHTPDECTQTKQTDTAVIVVASYHDNFCTVKLFDPMDPNAKEIASATVKVVDGKGIARATAEAFETLEFKAQKVI